MLARHASAVISSLIVVPLVAATAAAARPETIIATAIRPTSISCAEHHVKDRREHRGSACDRRHHGNPSNRRHRSHSNPQPLARIAAHNPTKLKTTSSTANHSTHGGSGSGSSSGASGSASGATGSTAGGTGSTVPGTTGGNTGTTSTSTSSGSGSGSGSASGSATSTPTPTGMPGSWNLLFDDEFNGTSLNTSNWSTGWFGSGITGTVNPSLESDCYDPSQDVVSGGALTISAVQQSETCDGAIEPDSSGLISTNGKFQFTYGAFEARIWMPGSGSTVADWPAFWADGQDWPADGEIDVAEGLSGQVCYHFHYPGGGPGGCRTVANAAGGWHTYAADWEPGSITYYYDGQEVWQDTTGVTSAPMYLILGLGVPSSGPVTVPASFKVDYVRVWQHPAA